MNWAIFIKLSITLFIFHKHLYAECGFHILHVIYTLNPMQKF